MTYEKSFEIWAEYGPDHLQKKTANFRQLLETCGELWESEPCPVFSLAQKAVSEYDNEYSYTEYAADKTVQHTIISFCPASVGIKPDANGTLEKNIITAKDFLLAFKNLCWMCRRGKNPSK